MSQTFHNKKIFKKNITAYIRVYKDKQFSELSNLIQDLNNNIIHFRKFHLATTAQCMQMDTA